MRKRHLSLICFLFSYIFTFGNGSDLYLLYDNSCMDQFDYELSKRDASGVQNTNYTTYHVKINDSEKVILNTAIKGATQMNRPAGTKYCGEVVISESLARQINSKKTKVHLVVKSTSGYIVYPIKSAGYFFTTDSEMGFSSKEFTFAYNYTTGSKKNLATKDSKGKVYFRGRDDKFCPSKYSFRRTPPKNFDPYSDFVLVPDVGMVEKKTGLDAATANNNVLTLKNINGIPLVQYMDAVCNGYVNYLSKEVAKTTTSTSSGKTTVTDLEGGNSTGTVVHTGTTHHTTGELCNHLYKDIDKGFYYSRNTGQLANESCGGISYRNGLVISRSTPSTTPTTTTTPTPETRIVYRDRAPETRVVYRDSPPKVIYKEGPEKVVYKDRVVYVDRPQDEFTSRGNTTTSTTPAGTTANAAPEFHVVQQKETLYGISKKYRVAVDEIKRWNNLKGNVISVGQNLRIRGAELVSKGAPTLGSAVPGTKITKTETLHSSTNSEYHVVQKKETLYSIAKKYGVSVDRLKQINKLKSNTISIGQRLNLTYTAPTSYDTTTVPSSYNTVTIPKDYSAPTPPASTATPEVLTSKGGSLSSTTAVASPAPKTTLVKEELISKGGTTKAATTTTDPLSVYDPAQKVHIVGDNETLYTIAKWYGTSVEKIIALNNFSKNEVLLPNQKVRVQ